MKLKLKPSRRQIVIVVVVAAVAVWVLLAGRSDPDQQPGTLDDAARTACDDFAEGRRDADTESARLSLADRVLASSRRTDNDAIADRASLMGRAANDGDDEWQVAADALTKACVDAGWTAP